ncbi:hypothetical protein KABACHOK_04910 [Brevundimonas phage vB_BpoS-Kabachok]|uniref:Uncharacterized protein n=1 Tax=Brevundimonas phage vB_BpoS-Kabachok TaxID=2948600 RepID=A0A9E7SKA1_9CAUD|nr:hypothetical protein KABACHOK_04910 [Brevundimonas phage vB_BpoS-Kabachok]
MGLAITIGVVIALTIALILWARGAIAAANRRHEAQVRANVAASASAARARHTREPSPSFQTAKADVYRKPSAASRTPYRSEIVDFGYVEYGASSSSGSYHSGGSCSSGGGSSGGDGGGGCD